MPMRLCFLPILFLASLSLHAQKFPNNFVGHWEGELQWFQTGKNAAQTVRMQLIIQPSDTAGQFTWQMIYEQNQDNRPYILKPIDTAKGHWVIDEKNGIMLDQYWIGNRLTGAFTVQNSTILNSYWIEGEYLVVEFYTTSAKPINLTGGTDKDIPPVDSYRVKSYQKAVLKKKN